MDPVFTLQWPEFLIANRLQKMLPKNQGFSVLIPVSRQEKGIDLAIIKKHNNGKSKVATIQIKASRAYLQNPPKRETTERYRYGSWFNRFDVPDEADFFLLFGMYAPDAGRTRRVNASWYRDCTLLFTRQEMKKFMNSCLSVAGKPDRMFGFGFNDDRCVVQTRGDRYRRQHDYTKYLLSNRIELLKSALGR